jgi:hypothetical protein
LEDFGRKFYGKYQDYISDLKLRFGWGQTGNQGIDNLATYALFVPEYGIGDPTWNIIDGTAYDLAGSGSGNLPSGYRKIQTENDDLKWETTEQTNIGLDFLLFKPKPLRFYRLVYQGYKRYVDQSRLYRYCG